MYDIPPSMQNDINETAKAIAAWRRVHRVLQRVESLDTHDETPAAMLGKLSVIAGEENNFNPEQAVFVLRNVADAMQGLAELAEHLHAQGAVGQAIWAAARHLVEHPNSASEQEDRTRRAFPKR